MAKSKSGGTRSYLRGRIGADVYSVGKDGKGAKQQVVRSLAEVVSNPQTEAQMRGRMIMSTVMQAVAAMSPICDHSFDNVPAGQPNISEFIRQNYALIKADVAAHPASGNVFGLNKYQEKGIKPGAYVISQGSATLPAAITQAESGKVSIALTAGTLTIGGLKSLLGGSGEDYLTICAVDSEYGFLYARLHVNTSLADTTAISAENVSSVFTTEGNTSVTFALSGQTITATIYGVDSNMPTGVIISVKENGAWKHNSVTLSAPTAPEYTADVALPTYPVGAARFLNGGDI